MSLPQAFRLDGKLALVTGAGRGIGRAIALALCDAGAQLVLVSRTARELEAAAAEIQARGGQARPVVCDVTDGAAVARVFAEISRLDILVNNAGVNRPQPFLEVDEATLDRMLALNVKAPFRLAQHAVRLMAGAQGGVVVNMSSQMGHVGSERDRTVYVMTKHAVEGMTKAMAAELAPSGIRVVSTQRRNSAFSKNGRVSGVMMKVGAIESRIPLGRIGTVEEVAMAVVFLCSPAAALVTGSSLLVDGGWTAW